MVDFDNETTVATPAKDVMKIYLLQQKAFLEDTWREFRIKDFAGMDIGLEKVRAAMEHLYIIIEPIITRHWGRIEEQKINPKDILEIIRTGKKMELLNMIILFNQLLDLTRLTRIDTKRAQKMTWEASNIQHGY